jgi:hypothetical protein
VLAGAVIESEDCWVPDAEIETLFYAGALEPAPVRRVAEASPDREVKPQPSTEKSTKKSTKPRAKRKAP